MKKYLYSLIALWLLALPAHALDGDCDYTAGTTSTATGFANCALEIAEAQARGAIATTSTNSGNNIIATSVNTPAVTTLRDGTAIIVDSPVSISGASQLNLDGTGLKDVVNNAGSAVGSGDLVLSTRYLMVYKLSNTSWYVMNSLGSGFASASLPYVTVGNTASLSAERAITAGTAMGITDGGADSTVTINLTDAELTSLAGLTSAANTIGYWTGSGTAAVTDFSAAIRTLITTPSSANLRSMLSDEIGTGGAMFGLISTMADDLSCTGSQIVRRNAGDTAFECATVAGSGDALVANPLSQFASTTSAQFAGVISNETGTGVVVLATSPALVTPDIGTPSAGTLTNATGLPLTTGIADNAGCTASQSVRRNAGDTAFECFTGGSGDALTSNPLSQFASTTSAQLRGVMSNETGTGNAMFGLSTDMTDDLACTGSQVLRRNSGDTAFECATVAGTGDALVANPLSQFASTTSAQFSGVISNETGTGVVVLDTDPALTGNPTAPTAGGGDDDTSIATTAFVNTAIAAAPSGGLTLLDTIATTSGTTFASIQLTPASYNKYYIEVDGVSFTAGAALSIAISGNNGANYGTALAISPATAAAGDTLDGWAQLGNINSAVRFGATLDFRVQRSSNGASVVPATGDNFGKNTTGASGAVDRIQFSGGTGDAGAIRIYGEN